MCKVSGKTTASGCCRCTSCSISAVTSWGKSGNWLKGRPKISSSCTGVQSVATGIRDTTMNTVTSGVRGPFALLSLSLEGPCNFQDQRRLVYTGNRSMIYLVPTRSNFKQRMADRPQWNWKTSVCHSDQIHLVSKGIPVSRNGNL